VPVSLPHQGFRVLCFSFKSMELHAAFKEALHNIFAVGISNRD
jgi:hypothetical protein